MRLGLDLGFDAAAVGLLGGASKAAPIQTDATVTTVGARKVLKFTKSGFFYTPAPITVRALVISAGGGASSGGGGGGAAQSNDTLTLPAGLYQIRVGLGGDGGIDTNTAGTNGGNSSFGVLVALGGGGGGPINSTPAASGGTGGGVGATSVSAEVGGTGSQGGNGGSNPSFFGSPFASAGGGGAGGNGGNPSSNSVAGAGGIGFQSDIEGANNYYGGGGGGAVFSGGGTPGTGGLGGGGNGVNAGNGANATAGTGGGGGGAAAGQKGGNGSDGVVIINAPATVQATPGVYLGPVVSRLFIPDFAQASVTGWNSVTVHPVYDDISELIVGDVNWRVFTNVGDFNQGGTATITRTVEYPPGVFTRLKYSGAGSITMADGGDAFTDALPITIPKSAGSFKIHKYTVSSVNLLSCSSSNAIPNTALGEGVNNANVDQTATGTVVDGSKTFLIPTPIVLARTNLPTIAALGSSRWAGVGDTARVTSNDAGYGRMVGPSFAYLNYGVGGESIKSIATKSPRRFSLARYCSHLWIDPGLNDLISFSGTGAGMLADIATLAARWPLLAKVIINDEGADTTSTNGFIDTVNQTVSGIEAGRVTLNTGIAALVGYNQIVGCNVFDGNGTNHQFWNNPVVGGFQATADGLHENTAQLQAMVAAHLFNPALVTNP